MNRLNEIKLMQDRLQSQIKEVKLKKENEEKSLIDKWHELEVEKLQILKQQRSAIEQITDMTMEMLKNENISRRRFVLD